MNEKFSFPKEFRWGVSTASYQIEGAWNKDGKGESIWDRFSHTPGNVKKGESGDIACDHYHRYREDVSLMKDLNIRAYRFSTSWPRVIPKGRGDVNERGINFYKRLVDELLANGIEPWVCLYHWDLPQTLQDEGGWANRDIVEDFRNYAETVARRLEDKVNHWVILNEPRVVAKFGYLYGENAPGIKNFDQFLKTSHHLQLAQGKAIQALRDINPDFKIGTVLNLSPVHPVRDKEGDLEAADRMDQFLNRWYLDPLLKGKYPPLAREAGLDPEDGDMSTIHQPIDFLGVNYYSRQLVTHDAKKALTQAKAVSRGAPTTMMNWEIYPEGLYEILTRLKEDYDDPTLYVTENGAAFSDEIVKNGEIQDDDRIRFLRDHIRAAGRAIEDGADLRGYFVWTLLDNFEWDYGYNKRFGLVHVDFETQRRTPKKSARWYKQTIEKNSVCA